MLLVVVAPLRHRVDPPFARFGLAVASPGGRIGWASLCAGYVSEYSFAASAAVSLSMITYWSCADAAAWVGHAAAAS